MIRALVQAEPIDLAAEIALVEGSGAGAIATFSGHVRADDGVTALELEHYPGMTDAALAGLAAEAQRRLRPVPGPLPSTRPNDFLIMRLW